MGERFKLTAAIVGQIRQSNLADSVWAKRFMTNRQSIHHARTGRTWKTHPVPPQPIGRIQPLRGFATMPVEKLREISRRGGRARAHWRAL